MQWKVFRLHGSSDQTAGRGHYRTLVIGPSVHLCLFLSVCCQEGRQEVQFFEATCTEGNGNMAGLRRGGDPNLPRPPLPPQGMLGRPHGWVWALPGWPLRHAAQSRRISGPCHLAVGSQWDCLTAPPPPFLSCLSLCLAAGGGGVSWGGRAMLACCSVKGNAC